ncbi:ras and EF-hand domain-containing protein homolog isoform X2 [Apis cerana]|uniref:ras and EF-hand domain-containing protein homolog isoform X2 n=1 Tax=Apis cerana TaxID=7461 RepID=UPI002B222B1D|nr:ras and EF-hand domain-containing protein homolog isoform X2 [Apis cerana]
MDRNESANEGGSSPDTVIARSSSEEERNRLACSTSGEYVTVGDSSSSLDTVTSVGTTTVSTTTDATGTEDKKRGRFGALKSSFRKEGGLFKIKKKNRQLDEPAAELQPDVEEKDSEQKSPRPEARCSSTLPYAISKWSEQKASRSTSNEPTKKPKLNTKSESESSISRSSVREVRRKLSLLEEKRAIFQRRLFESNQDSDSGETVIAITIDDEKKTLAKKEENRVEQSKTKKKARHISVKKFDTFSTFEGTFDEETGIGYLAGIEEDYTESYERQHDNYVASMGPMMADNTMEKSKVNQESMSSQNNSPNAGLGEKREHLYKILVIGELGAGKTSIIKRYVHQFFSQHYRATIGVDFALKVLNWDPHTIIRLQLWDIAGQERFGNMTRVYYKEAVGAFIVFDVTRSATLDAVVKWKQDLDSKVQLPDGSPIPCVLLANKCDQQKEGLVNSPAKMDEYCKEKNFAGWFETSAKENINIEEAARFLVNKILQNDQLMKGNGSQDQTDGERFALNQSPNSSKKSCSC